MTARKIGKVLRDMGPLVLIALLVPGGTLIVAVVYLLRRAVRPSPIRGGREGT